MSNSALAGDCGGDSPALLMPKNDDQFRSKVLDGILNTGENVIIDYVACHANHKQISQALVEQQFWRNTRIGAAENHRKRMLALASCLRRAGDSSGCCSLLATNRAFPAISLASALSGRKRMILCLPPGSC